MKNPLMLFGALGIGAGLMYFLDPDRGKRRRAVIRDRAVHLSNEANRKLNKTGVDLRNRFQGVWFEAEKLFENETPTDEQLEEKIRTFLGRLSSHPHAVKTEVKDGKVVLSGFVLADEERLVLNGISSICGVKEVENRLEAHEAKENHPKLQGADRRRNSIIEKQKKWSARTRILAAAAGGGLMIFGAKKRDAISSLLASAGVGLVAHSLVNKPVSEIISASGETAITVHKTITIDAPAERVFEVLKYPQYFPNFMSHVRLVEQLGEKQFFWLVDGIAGLPVEMATEVTEVVPNELIRWKNVGSERNGQNGFLRLEKVEEGKTRLHVEMKYQPLGGKFGHFVAGLFGSDPKSELDDDFLRLKTYIEKGKLPRDAAAIANEKRRKEMKVKEIMTKNPVFATLSTSLHDVAQMMSENDCGIVPIVETEEDRKPIGVITDRDIALRTIAHNKNPLNMIAGEVMTDTVVTVKPEFTVEDCVQVMEKNQIRRVLVIDDAGNLNGIVAQADIARMAPPFQTAELLKDVSMAQAMRA